MLTPRPYQQKALDATYDYWRNGGSNGVVVVPTGGGKSLIQALLIKEICEGWPGTRILVLTHVKELVEQNYNELLEAWPEAPAGIYSAGLKRKEIKAQVLFTGIQSIDKHIHKLDPPPKLVLIDECHLIPQKSSTRYRKVMSTLQLMYPKVRLLGLTATEFRMETGYLHTGENALFTDIIYKVDVNHLIDNGWLCRPVIKNTVNKINTLGVKHTGKEFNAHDLQERVMEKGKTQAIVSEIIEKGRNRKKWLIFATGIKHAEEIRDELEAFGIIGIVVTGKTPVKERDQIVRDYRNNIITTLINVNVFTTGFNVKDVDFIPIIRPTESPVLIVQMIGRGMRTFPGKVDCLVLDYGGNIERHGPIDAIRIKDKALSAGDGEAPIKTCPDCMSLVYAGARECPDCGYLFPPPKPKLETKASTAAIMAADIMPEVLKVQKTVYYVHKKAGKPDSVRVEYQCGLTMINEWVFPESTSQKQHWFYSKWCAMAGLEKPYPIEAKEFVFMCEAQATEIEAIQEGKYWKVRKRVFKGIS